MELSRCPAQPRPPLGSICGPEGLPSTLDPSPPAPRRPHVEEARRECSGLHRCFCRSQAADSCPQLHLQPAPLWFAAQGQALASGAGR